MKCSRCGAKGLTFGHQGLCDSCRLKMWERERQRLAEAKEAHPAGKGLAKPHVRLVRCECHSPTRVCPLHAPDPFWEEIT